MNRAFVVASRFAGKQVAGSAAPNVTRPLSTVAANTIKIIFVDQEGNRAIVPARIGQTILDVAVQHKIDLEGPCGGGGSPREVRRTENWVETTYGEGPNCFFCHVQIPSSYTSVLPPSSKYEQDGLADSWDDEVTKNSHLACMITLDRRHDGLTVFVPDAPPTDLV